MARARQSRPGMGLALLLCTALWLTPLPALERLTLDLADLQGAGWSLADAGLELGWSATGVLQARLYAARARLPEPLGELRELQLECAELEQDGGLLHCRQGRLRTDSALLGRIDAGLTWKLDRAGGALELRLPALHTPQGRMDLDLQLGAGAWQARLELHALDASTLPPLVAPWFAAAHDWSLQGSVRGRLRLSGRGAQPERVTADLELRALDYANAAGTQAGEALDLRLQLEAQPRAGGWQLALQAQASRGQLYAAPMFFEFAPASPLELQAQVALDPGRISIPEFRWDHAGTLHMHGAARLVHAGGLAAEWLRLDIGQAVFPAAFETYLQPWLLDTTFADLRTSGALRAGLEYEAGAVTGVQLTLQDLGLDDPQGRIRLEGLAGELAWAGDDRVRRQHIRWDAGQLYRVALGALTVELETRGHVVELAAPARLPVLDGSLQVDQFRLQLGEALEWSLDAALTPISMTALTRALGWPEMAGSLSGMIPAVQYRDGEVRVGGTLLVGAFDGDIIVRNLRMDEPLGTVPRLWADIRIQGLDLETLTRTFAFGRIEGRLDGAVEGLQLEAWRPVAFDAWLATPEGDRSRQRISQRAVDNLTNIGGGGVGGALSRGFLSFLEDFPYRAIGIRCRLEQGTCHMGGVAPAEQGYYLVQGRLLPPRIDVIGYEDRVDWESLLQRLQAVTAEEGPVVR